MRRAPTAGAHQPRPLPGPACPPAACGTSCCVARAAECASRARAHTPCPRATCSGGRQQSHQQGMLVGLPERGRRASLAGRPQARRPCARWRSTTRWRPWSSRRWRRPTWRAAANAPRPGRRWRALPQTLPPCHARRTVSMAAIQACARRSDPRRCTGRRRASRLARKRAAGLKCEHLGLERERSRREQWAVVLCGRKR